VFDRVIVPLDGSPTSEAILPAARAAAAPGGQLHLLRVVPPPLAAIGVGFGDPAAVFVPPPEDDAAEWARAEAYLQRIAAHLAPGPAVHTLVRRGRTADEIVLAARELGAELIAMSTHGRTGLGLLVMGSVAGEVVRSAQTPVLLVRPDATTLKAADSAPASTGPQSG